ncbi:ABC-type Fe3+-siderophore transport system permease component [Rubrobacter radiotolerans]|uniref:ABC-type Fe3+-siderophore transport system permease component n=1 Tax=Rubrobacter radiotolerans TaxID=42256 RepID=A0A023X6P2_RUBRA|nr:iron ABC transporter permease [Rubrobacter radiotolerans]AHY47675.1 ABC-type Fe3+-siderophore transport system permease component [Rubrobacter radiotolerans]MDX5895078.1 iron ABC transporter permease [Rubrobacter radiotolerans]SMC07404.1 iron complex transport system permease protein [Rubrobacter radiotolerans DSM 5868]
MIPLRRKDRWRGEKVVRGRGFSYKVDLRSVGVFVALLLVALTGVVLNVGVGEYPISPPDVVRTILGFEVVDGNYSFIVNTLRLPRALVALLVGVALALSGAILQGLTRNPLAAPDIIGINAGAGLAAVTLIVVFPSASAALIPPAAFVGAVGVAALLYVIAWRGSSSPIRLILIGIGLGAIAGAATTFMITFGNIYEVSQALIWLTGSVYGRSWDEVASFLPWLLVFVPLVLILSRQLNALSLGDEVATGLGSRVERERGLLILASVALAASAVATAGTIGFVAFIAPHIARQLVGPNHGGLLPVSAAVGGVIVVLADLAGRTVFAPVEIPAGIITSIIGAPYFLYLLYRSSRTK